MKTLRTHGWIVATLLVMVGGAAAFPWDASEFMSLDEIKPGMLAEAHTVFSGTKVESFQLEIVSIRSTGQGKHVIWAQGKGDRIEHIGIASGMSGSPVTIQGRLIGAIAYGYPGAKDAWAGITPIGEMLGILDRDMTPRLSRASASFGIDQYLAAMRALHEDERGKLWLPQPMAHVPMAAMPERLKIPLMFAGFEPGAIDILKPFFAGRNLLPVQGAAADQQDQVFPLEPGQMIAKVYATGDQSLYEYGTVTYRHGNQVLAYGHPSSLEGQTNYPIAGGRIDQVVATREMSFKVGSAGKPSGTLVQDRISGIAGLVGEPPAMAPLTVRVTRAGGEPREFHYDIFLGDETLGGAIAGTLVWNSVESAERSAGDYTLDIHLDVALDGMEAIRKDIVTSGMSSPASAAYLALYAPLSALLQNEFTPLTVQSIDVEVNLRDSREVAQIREVRLNKSVFRPGETILATVVLQPYLDAPVLEHLEIPIPEDAPEGPMNLLVTNAVSHQNWQRARAPENYRPRTIDQLLKILREGETSYHIITELFIPKLGMTVEGEEYPELPFSMLYVMSSPSQSGEGGFTRGSTLSVQKYRTPYVVVGSHTLRITIDRNAD